MACAAHVHASEPAEKRRKMYLLVVQVVVVFGLLLSQGLVVCLAVWRVCAARVRVSAPAGKEQK